MSIQIYRKLERAGLRATVLRVMVLDFFHKNEHGHFSAEQISSRLAEKDGHTNLSSVYRVLAQLVQSGLLATATFDERVVYELNHGRPHDHIVCTRCGCIEEFFDPLIEERQKAMADSVSFSLTGHHLVLYGVCAKCEQEKAERQRGLAG
ncbi:Fur family transcriptional regulator [Paraburkholderia sp.]|uniref:Fur family transcriptional regulator n=1 Tax=Paraburkholderia sp. TaxID=1926495 RepID=UPI002399434D|nr:Fur family transcriptional regulator [Paraburkholderia sp.]MDE1182002.1 Fur family transcriptional regulator [Paraburkholderia sp.]